MTKNHKAITTVAWILIALVIVGGGYYLYSSGKLGFVKQTAMADGCSILKPTWQYYLCDHQPLTPPPTFTFQIPKGNPFSMRWSNGETISCNKADIYDQGANSCTVRMTNKVGNGPIYYKLCQNYPCDCSGSDRLQFPNNGEIKTPLGTVISFCAYPDILQDWSASFQATYEQKYLVKYTWTGQRLASIGLGCNLRAVLSSNNWNMLSQSDFKESLAPGESVNFIDTYISVPVIGNYFANTKYGDVVCEQSSMTTRYVYQLQRQNTATPSSDGKYTTLGNTCYYTVASSGTSVHCCPGEPMGAKVCNNDFEWVGIDKGVCVRGGLADPRLCPGGGGAYCDPNSWKLYGASTCNENTGNCERTERSVSCCPGHGCAGDEFCNADYVCQKKPIPKLSCNYECCVPNSYYETKACPSGLTCCETGSGTGTCKENCKGIVPPIPNITECGSSFAKCGSLTDKACCTGYECKGAVPVVGGGTCTKIGTDWGKILIPLIGAVLVFFMLGGIQAIQEREWDKLGLAIGISLVSFFLIAWVLKNLVAIMVGSAIAGILGGAVIYFAGGVILVIVLILMQIIKAIRGG